jgi:hypothetical protein
MTPQRRGTLGVRLGALPAVLAALVCVGCGASGSTAAHGRSVASGLVLEHSGLLADYPFDRSTPSSALTSDFRLGGTATGSGGVARLLPDGLHVSVGPHQPGMWKGFFAATSATYPANSIFHVRMSRSLQQLPSPTDSGIVLLAVQTASSNLLDYVVVAGVVTRNSDYWTVGYATGNPVYSKTKILWIRQIESASEDVTLQTDGHSHYVVYLGGKRVYQSQALDMHVAPPFRAYVEVEARGRAYQTSFQDLWVAADDAVTFEGLPSGTRVAIAPHGAAPVYATADAAGQARVVLPLTEAFGTGSVTINGPGVHRRFAQVRFAGGDVYRVLAQR